jgi:hypothetical protein
MPWHDLKLSAIDYRRPDASHRLIEAPVEEWSNDKGVDSGGSRAGAGANACKSCRHRDTASIALFPQQNGFAETAFH